MRHRTAGAIFGFLIGGVFPAFVTLVWLARPVHELPRDGAVGAIVMGMGGAHGFAFLYLPPVVLAVGGVLGAKAGAALGGRMEERMKRPADEEEPWTPGAGGESAR